MEGGVDREWLSAADPVVYKRLQEELGRVSEADPFGILGVSHEAGAADIRRAFLARTKVFHPNRFARRDPEIRRLAHEVFLRINKAYSRLESEDGRRSVLDRLGKEVGPKRGRFSETEQTAIPVSIDGEVGSGAIRTNARSGTEERAPASTQVTFTKAREAEQGGAKQPAGASSAAARRRLTSSRRARLRQQLAPSAPEPPARAHAEDPNRVVARAGQREEEHQEKFKQGRQLVREGKIPEARETFRQLAVANPTEKKYRVYMHYAWGREHQAAGRQEQARAEYKRALHLDPAFEPARRSMNALSAKKDKEGGLFSRLFRK